MMSCDTFRNTFHAATEDAALLAHLRTCDRCLDFAANADPDVMFRALGGDRGRAAGGAEVEVAQCLVPPRWVAGRGVAGGGEPAPALEVQAASCRGAVTEVARAHGTSASCSGTSAAARRAGSSCAYSG